MKKIKFLVIIGFVISFVYGFWNLNTNALVVEDINDTNKINDIDDVSDYETSVYYFISNANCEIVEDKLFINFYFQDELYRLNLSDYDFYSFDSIVDEFTVRIDVDNIYITDIKLVFSKIKVIDNYFNIHLGIIHKNYNKIISIDFRDEIDKMEYLNLNYYKNKNNNVYDDVYKTVSNYEKLIYNIKKANEPQTFANNTENIIIAQKSYTSYNDPSIRDYIPSNDFREHEGIIEFIPLEYFTNVGEKVEYGEEYGFYIKTIDAKEEGLVNPNNYPNTSPKTSYVSVFVLEHMYPTGLNSTTGDSRDLTIRFIPLFNLRYYIGFTTEYLGCDISFPLDCGYSEFKINNIISNYNAPNVGDTDYSHINDDGMCVDYVEYGIINHENNGEEISSYFLADLFMTVVGYIPYFEVISDVYSITSLIQTRLEESTEYPAGTFSSEDLSFKYTYKPNVHQYANYGNYIKDITFGFQTPEPNKYYYIGRYNYATFSNGFAEKVGFYAKIGYNLTASQNLSNNDPLLQNSITTFLTTFNMFDQSYNVKIAFYEENYFQYGDINLYTVAGELNPSFEKDTIIPVLFSSTTTRAFDVTPSETVQMNIYNQFGVCLFSKYVTNTKVRVIFPFLENERYFIKFECASNPTISCKFVNTSTSIISRGNNLTSVGGYGATGHKYTISTGGFLNIYTYSTADTELYIYNGDILLAYNDYWYTWDEEMNEEYVAQAHLYVYLDPGTYYIIVGSKSSGSYMVEIDIK